MTEPNSPRLARRVRATELRKQAVFARMGGKTYSQIATELHISTTRAFQLVTEGLAESRIETAAEAERLRTVELARLDFLLETIWGQVIKGDVQAIDRALKVMKRRAELLGLDAPVKQDITTGGEKIKAYIGWTPSEWESDEKE